MSVSLLLMFNQGKLDHLPDYKRLKQDNAAEVTAAFSIGYVISNAMQCSPEVISSRRNFERLIASSHIRGVL